METLRANALFSESIVKHVEQRAATRNQAETNYFFIRDIKL